MGQIMSQVKKEVDVEFNVITPFGPKVGVGALPKAIYKKFEKIANKTLIMKNIFQYKIIKYIIIRV
jgi:hypothetical protein